MKKFTFLSFFLLLFACMTFAQVPQKINYQAVATNNSGDIIKNGTVGLRFSILQGSANGTVIFKETHQVVSDENGIINLLLGGGTPQSGTFSDIDWGAGDMFLKTEMDANGGTSYTNMGTTQMVSVPYSLYTGSIYVNYSNDTLYIGDKWVYMPGGGTTGGGNTVTDYDGNEYSTVVIGTQTWLSENLRSMHYSNGSAINGVFDYDNNTSYSSEYGKLYTWDAAMKGASSSSASPSGIQGVCPTGYHVPSHSEWETLYNYVKNHYEVGGSNIGKKLKESGTTHWETDNGTNETGFTAVGSGEMFLNGGEPDFQQLKEAGDLWSTTEFASNDAQALEFRFYDSGSIMVQTNTVKNKDGGLAVRCLKD